MPLRLAHYRPRSGAASAFRACPPDSAGVAVVIHSIMSQLLYAGLFVAISVPVEQFRRGAELMSVHGAQLAGMGLRCGMFWVKIEARLKRDR